MCEEGEQSITSPRDTAKTISKAVSCTGHDNKKQVSDCWVNPVHGLFVEPLTLNQLGFTELGMWDIAGSLYPMEVNVHLPMTPSLCTVMLIIISSNLLLLLLQYCLGLLAKAYNGNSLCLQRVFPSFWCLLTTSPFRCTQFPSLLNSCKPSSPLGSVVNTYTMFIFFSFSPGIIPAKDVKPLRKVEIKCFPLWRTFYHPCD